MAIHTNRVLLHAIRQRQKTAHGFVLAGWLCFPTVFISMYMPALYIAVSTTSNRSLLLAQFQAILNGCACFHFHGCASPSSDTQHKTHSIVFHATDYDCDSLRYSSSFLSSSPSVCFSLCTKVACTSVPAPRARRSKNIYIYIQRVDFFSLVCFLLCFLVAVVSFLSCYRLSCCTKHSFNSIRGFSSFFSEWTTTTTTATTATNATTTTTTTTMKTVIKIYMPIWSWALLVSVACQIRSKVLGCVLTNGWKSRASDSRRYFLPPEWLCVFLCVVSGWKIPP